MKFDFRYDVKFFVILIVALFFSIIIFLIFLGWGSIPVTDNLEAQQSPIEAVASPDLIKSAELRKIDALGVSTALYWITGLSVVVALIAVAVALTAFWWRLPVEGGQQSVLPNEVIRQWKSVTKMLQKQDKTLSESNRKESESLKFFRLEQTKTQKDYQDILDSFRIFQDELTGKEEVINRLKAGADAQVFRRFLNRFLRVHKEIESDIEEARNDSGDESTLQRILDMLEDALMESGLERFSPRIGENFRDVDGLASGPMTKETDDPEQDYKIAEVLSDGFFLQGPEKPQYIRKARVIIYKLQKKDA